jgi:hypothetical protein
VREGHELAVAPGDTIEVGLHHLARGDVASLEQLRQLGG